MSEYKAGIYKWESAPSDIEFRETFFGEFAGITETSQFDELRTNPQFTSQQSVRIRMRPENEWFKPEKLKMYYFLYEAVGFVILVAAGGFLAFLGVLADAPLWVVAFVIGVPLVVFAFLTWWIPAFYQTAAYRLTDDEIEYRRGVFFQQKTTVPYKRITNVNASQGPIQRLVDAGSVGIHTAGYGGQMGAELTISGVSDYEEIKDQVLTKVRRRRSSATEGDDQTIDEERATVDSQPSQTREELAELRRIRELLEQEFTE
jgi:uncharacterized membrane protein YdbT with pleckstrin-like domain